MPTKEDTMHIILTQAGDHLPGAYTYRTEDQRLIGRIFTPISRQDFVEQIRQFRIDLDTAPLETDILADLSGSSRQYIDHWIIGGGAEVF